MGMGAIAPRLSALGYLAYLAFIFLPGLGAGELLRLWKDENGFTSRLAYSFGIGLCIDTIVVVVRTAGITRLLTGLDSFTVYATIAFGSGMLAVSLVVRRRFSWWRRPTKLDLAFLGILLLQGLIIIFYLQEYPVFPGYLSHDIFVHVPSTERLIAGTLSSIPRGVLYFGVYYQLAPAILTVGGAPLVTVRWTMAILAVLSTLLFYLAAEKLSGSQACGVITALVYALSGPIWFGMVFFSEVYSNFFGVLAALFLLVVYLDAALGSGARGAMITLALATIMAYLSHYSTVTLLPAILLFPFVNLALNRQAGSRPFVAAGVVVLPGLLGVIAFPRIVSIILRANLEFGAATNGSTPLAGLFSPYPVLSYMAIEVNYDLSFIVLAALACICIWRFWSSKAPVIAIPIIWMVTLLVVAPFNLTAWRYAFEALVPFTLMAGLGLFSLLPRSKAAKGRQNPKGFYRKPGIVLLLVLLLIVASSWGASAVSNSINNTGVSAETQSLDYQCVTWLGANTPQNATYLSVSDVRFIFTSLLIGRNTTYQFTSTPSSALQIAHSAGATYIIVTDYVTGALPADPSLLPWNNFPTANTSNLALIYQNTGVRVYHIV